MNSNSPNEKTNFEPDDIYDLWFTIAKFVYPRVKAFRSYPKGYPPTLTAEEWDNVIDKMVEAFELLATVDSMKWSEEQAEKVNHGLVLFAKWYTDLWT